jgi:hypothetical protein
LKKKQGASVQGWKTCARGQGIGQSSIDGWYLNAREANSPKEVGHKEVGESLSTESSTSGLKHIN